MVGATSKGGAAYAVLRNGAPKRCSQRLVGRLAVVAKEAVVMVPEGTARELGAVKALGARGGLAKAVREVVVVRVARAEVTAAVVVTAPLPC